MVNQLTFGETNTDGRPCVVYVASPISSLLSDEVREQIVKDCMTIKLAAETAADLGAPPWRLTARVPCLETSPWETPDTAPEDIFNDNLRLFASEADALIVHGGWGGSVGVGQEFGWAASLRLPTLFLNMEGQPVSRQVLGTPMDLEVHDFASWLDLPDLVISFIQRRRHSIESHSLQRADRALSVAALLIELRDRWGDLDASEVKGVAAVARLDPRRIALMLEDPALLRGASLDEIVALAGSLGIDLGQQLTGKVPGQVTPEQMNALRTAAEEFEWDGPEALELLRDAQLELAKGGIRRFPLSTPGDWYRFKQR